MRTEKTIEMTLDEKIEDFCKNVSSYNNIDKADKQFLYEVGMSIVDKIDTYPTSYKTQNNLKKLFAMVSSFIDKPVPDYYYRK